jgi:hypothetical protein
MKTSNNRKTGRASPCVNAEYTDPDFRDHIMKTVYVRASMRDRRSIKSRNMLALGYFCFKCRQFWTNEDVNKIIEEDLQKLREKQMEEEYVRRHNNNTEIVN